MSDINDSDFINQVRIRAKDKVEEIAKLKHEQQRIEMQVARAQQYLEKLNGFLMAERQSPEVVREYSKGSPVGKPGNRAKDFPIRKPEWEDMTLWEVVKAILAMTPNDTLHVDVIARKIWEIESQVDLKRVKQSLVSTLNRGAKEKGYWDALGNNKFKAKNTIVRERLVTA